jgi:hypothetical protein
MSAYVRPARFNVRIEGRNSSAFFVVGWETMEAGRSNQLPCQYAEFHWGRVPEHGGKIVNRGN